MASFPNRFCSRRGVCALCVATALWLLLAPPRAQAAHERLQVGDPVRFSLQTTRGRLTSSALEGRTYAVVFWNTGSKKFAQALPDLRHLVKERATQDFMLVGYSVDASASKTHQAIAQGKMTWPQGIHEGQPFAFYDVFYTRRSPVPGAFLISATGQVRWLGPLSQLVDQVQAALPEIEGTANPRAAGVAAQQVYRELLHHAPDAARVLEHLRAIPDDAWAQNRGVRLSLRRAARRLARLPEHRLFALRQAAVANTTDAARFERLWALRPERRPTDPDTTDTSHATAGPDPDPADGVALTLAQARAAEADDDLLTAWEHYRAAADDPDAGSHRRVAQTQLRRLEDQPDFATRLTAARRERSANDLFVKAMNLLAADQPHDADATLREIRRTYHDTPTAAAAERVLAQIKPDVDESNR